MKQTVEKRQIAVIIRRNFYRLFLVCQKLPLQNTDSVDVVENRVDFIIQPKTANVEITAADCRNLSVNENHLGMKKAFRITVNLHSAGKQFVKICLCDKVRNPFIGNSGRDNFDFDSA